MWLLFLGFIKKRKRLAEFLIIFFIGLLLSALFLWPLLTSGNNYGISDWDHFLSQIEFARKTVVEYRQFPFWNPWLCGGFDNSSFPESNYFSIFLPLSILFGTNYGVKLGILIYYLLGFIGFFFLCKYLRLSFWASLVGSVVFVFSGVVSSAIGVGMVNFIYQMYTPYIFLFFLRFHQSQYLRYAFLTAFFLALIIYADFHVLTYVLPNLFLLSIYYLLVKKQTKPIKNLIIVTVITIIIALPKLILYFNVLGLLQNGHINNSGYSLRSILYFLLSLNQHYHYHYSGIPYGNDENSLYIGIIAFILFFTGLFVKKKPKYLILLLLSNLFIMLGDDVVFFNLWRSLEKLPLLQSIRVAQRFRFGFIVPVAILCGYGFSYYEKYLKKISNFKKRISLYFYFLFLLFFELSIFCYVNFLTKSFIIKISKTKLDSVIRNVNFYQTSEIIDSYKYSISTSHNIKIYEPLSPFQFIATKNNIGLIHCSIKPNLLNFSKSLPASRNSKYYYGEWYFLNQKRKVKPKYWSPNKIELSLNTIYPDKLVINQNYDSGWYVFVNNKKFVSDNFNGLLSVKLKKGYNKVVFSYKPYQKYIDGLLAFISARY
jgi:hypothetical protein